MNTPNIKQLAQASSASYGIISKGNRQTRLDKTQQKAPQNYTVVDKYTDKDMSTFKHNDDGHFIIAHRGSSFSLDDTSKKDIIADANIAFGNTTDDALHKRRTKKTEQIIKKIKKESGADTDIHLTGHSLGGHSANHAMVHSAVVRDNVKSVNTFNAGSSVLGTIDLAEDSPEYKTINDKSTHHSIINDSVSANAKSSLIGSVKKYKDKSKPSFTKGILKIVTPLLEGSPVGKIALEAGKKIVGTIGSHGIGNFT